MHMNPVKHCLLRLSGITALGLGLMAAGSAQAAPFTNGSFESAASPCTRTLIPTGQGPTGWFNGTSGDQVHQAGLTDDIPAQDGACYVSFGHNGTAGGSLRQAFDTEMGAVYEVRYFIATQQGFDTNQKAAAFVYDEFNLSSSGYIAGEINDVSSTSKDWMAGKVVRFTAKSATTTVMFQDVTPTGGGTASNWGLDNVTVTKVSGGTTPPPVTPPQFTATITGFDYLQTVVGHIRVGSADVGKSLNVYVLVALKNGLVLGKSGTGNTWTLISRNFMDIPVTHQFVGSATVLDVPLYAETNLKGLGAVVYIGYGTSLADMITSQKFGLLTTVE